MRIFFGKRCKTLPQRRGRIPVGLRRLGPAYYYNFVKFISSAIMRFITFKKEQILHIPNFCSYFSLQTL